MKIKFTTILAGTILVISAITGAILPTSAIGTNPVVPQPMNVKTHSLLLAGEHTNNARQSTQDKHQKAAAAKKKAQERKNPSPTEVQPTKADKKAAKEAKKDQDRERKNEIKGHKSGSENLKKK